MVLGEVVPRSIRDVAAARAMDTVLVLPRRTFDGAEQITLHTTADGRLARALFDYPTEADFDALLADYQSLGAGTRSIVSRPGESEPAIVVTWQDPRTGFRLPRDPNRSAWTIRSELWDRSLVARLP